MGFSRIVMPRGNASQLTPEERAGLEIVGAPSLSDALALAFE